MENPEFQKAAAAQAMNIDFMPGDDYSAYLTRQETEFRGVWGSVKDQVRAAN